MLSFKVEKRSSLSRARVGLLETGHGVVETPAFVTVATRAVVRALTSKQVEEAQSKLLIANTFHLHLRPGEDLVEEAGGLHRFMGWQHPLMTDSGGFQVFSLGFGQDLGVGKITKTFPGEDEERIIEDTMQPQKVRIEEEGVRFRSPIDGKEIFLGPEESMAIQGKLGSDIAFAFDECTSPFTSKEYLVKSLARTHRWARRCLLAKRPDQSLYGIIQGSHYRELREEACREITALPFDGYGIGGDLGKTKEDMLEILDWTVPALQDEKPRHLLGIGYLADFRAVIAAGADTFDCIVPTIHGRHGIVYTSEGRLNLKHTEHQHAHGPLDPACSCAICCNHSRSYLAHLVRVKDIAGLAMCTFHNLHFFNTYIAQLREEIRNGTL